MARKAGLAHPALTIRKLSLILNRASTISREKVSRGLSLAEVLNTYIGMG